jgi:hypothetical protein
MFLHVIHAQEAGFGSVVLVCEDTDVFILAVFASAELQHVKIHQKSGNEPRRRIVDIKAIRDAISPVASKCHPGLHAYTGCDTVSAFGGKGKLKAWKLVQQNEDYQQTLSELGNEEKVCLYSNFFTYNFKALQRNLVTFYVLD